MWHCALFLAQSGLRKGNPSEFVADAVRWRLFDLNVTSARAKNADVPGEEIEDAIEEALAEYVQNTSGSLSDADRR